MPDFTPAFYFYGAGEKNVGDTGRENRKNQRAFTQRVARNRRGKRKNDAGDGIQFDGGRKTYSPVAFDGGGGRDKKRQRRKFFDVRLCRRNDSHLFVDS